MPEGEVKILDHGYLKFIEHWGSDERIVETARMSTNKGFRSWLPYRECRKCLNWDGDDLLRTECTDGAPHDWRDVEKGDAGLLRYLHAHKHSTPFEFAGLTIEVKAPILVYREWHRHRVPFGYNEMSARYVPLPNENYSPTIQRIIEGAQSAGRNRQAQGLTSRVPEEAEVQLWLDRLMQSYDLAQAVYEEGLAIGVPKELARCPVPVARYSRMRATGNLRGWLAFLTLRTAPVAQWEIRQYAWAVAELISKQFPRTYALWVENKPGARS